MQPNEEGAVIAGAAAPGGRHGDRRWLLAVPVVGFAALAAAFALGLHRDPHLVPSPLVGKPVPQFTLPPVKGETEGFSSVDLTGQVALVNVFASWCVPCRAEHPILMDLEQRGAVPIYGIDYKDKPDDAAQWLDRMGNPYRRAGADLDGRVSIDWGVYGVPETFLVDAQGRIVLKQVGPMTPEIAEQTILPAVARLRRGAER
jgi:cytochrome c biogenesis protein CcmG/thiol:disulfide interchange protein DsbE